MDKVFNKVMRRLGLKDEAGYCDTSIVGFIVLWLAYGYGGYMAIVALIDRFI